MISKRELIVAGFALAMPQASWAQDVITLPLQRKNGCLTVQVKINDQGPFTFLADLGGGFASIPTELANRLRLQLIGDGLQPYVIIVGAQAYPAFRVNAANVVFGKDLVRKNVVFMRVPTQALKDSEFDGSMGSALVLAKPSILIWMPKKFAFIQVASYRWRGSVRLPRLSNDRASIQPQSL